MTALVVGLLLGGWASGTTFAQPYAAQVTRALRSYGFSAPQALSLSTLSTPVVSYPGTTLAAPANGDTWIDTAAGNWTTAATTINLKARNNAVTRTIASVTF